MEATVFNDLHVRIGYPYYYRHQGKCDHMLVFTEVRLFDPAYDPPIATATSYPLQVFQSSFKRRICEICETTRAK